MGEKGRAVVDLNVDELIGALTYDLVTGLLADEVRHEEFLENLLGTRKKG